HHASDNDDVNYQFILERVESASNKGEFFLRLTIENHDKANLDLSTIPHEIVDDLKLRVYLAGSTKMSESINNSIQVSAAKGQKFYSEENRTYSHLFEQFSKTALGNIDRINFHWDKSFAEYLRKSTPGTSLPVFKKIFLTLEDQTIGDLLKHGETIRISIGKIFVSLFLSRLLNMGE
ncbi:MAG: hypothetical protein K8R21_04375, partial [Leptospira sp.]|nr:hypothetical protein [Leptospira sp.]